jgi:putative oxidoreductase
MSGFGKLAAFNSTVAQTEAHGVPAPFLAVSAAIFIEIVCGLMLLFGYETKFACWGLLVFLALATLFFHVHDWQAATDPMAKMDQFVHILKNVSLMGGVLYVGSVESTAEAAEPA